MKSIFLLLLVTPILALSFSETELESLEDSGRKTFSKNPWRRDMGFSLIRNLDIETRHKNLSQEEGNTDKQNKFCDPKAEGSLCDLSNLYYNLDFTVYYSLAQWTKKRLNYPFLKGTEFFLTSYFRSNFSGGICSDLIGYDNFKGYVECGVGDITGGWTSPIYDKNSFFSYFNFSMIVWPLSKESKDSTLKTAFNSSVSALYFFKKRDKWSGAISSNHSLVYNHFTNPRVGEKGHTYNNPFDSNQQLSLIFKQNFNKYLPANARLFIAYSFTINTANTYWIAQDVEKNSNKYWDDSGGEEHQEHLATVVKKNCPKNNLGSVIVCGNRYQHLALGLSSSWKLDQRAYLALSVKWKDLINVHNPFNKYFDKKVELGEPPSLDLDKWYFALRASYSF
ncbi:MAG: hypothetical protein OXJ52_02655 [Oligoflexia bacterium]|nr:hypothetical protein [Oligoflexia bacterium]